MIPLGYLVKLKQCTVKNDEKIEPHKFLGFRPEI